jgi:N-formylglutamate deformylase
MDHRNHPGSGKAEPPSFTLQRGDTPLLVSLPHVGVQLSEGLRERLTDEALALPDTDWHVEKLYAFAKAQDVSVLEAQLSRYVIDLNRDPSGASLYPGKSTTELCPTTTFAAEPLYRPGAEPTADEQARRQRDVFWPYHQTLHAELARIRSRHGYAILLEGHSIRSHVPRFFEGRLPDLNLGSADGQTASAQVEQAARSVLEASGMSWVVNGRFKGGYITRKFGRPADQIHALQLEMAWGCYMQEEPPYAFEAARAAPLIAVLKRVVDALLHVQP